jgi:hypothetical protein
MPLPPRHKFPTSKLLLLDGIHIPTTVEVDVNQLTRSFPHIIVCLISRKIPVDPVGEVSTVLGVRRIVVVYGRRQAEVVQSAEIVDHRLKSFARGDGGDVEVVAGVGGIAPVFPGGYEFCFAWLVEAVLGDVGIYCLGMGRTGFCVVDIHQTMPAFFPRQLDG